MKLLLPAALVLSLLLNGLLAWQRLKQPPMSSPPSVARTVVVEKEQQVASSFAWQQLEAPDFATYIANLRRAGCPEHTLRAIIQPEVRQVVRAQQNEKRSLINEPALAAEETRLMESLLAVQPMESSVSSPRSAAGAHETPAQLPSLTSTAPAAFLIGNAPDDPVLTSEGLSISPSDRSLPPETLQRLAEMRRQFGERASTSPESPTNAADAEALWRKARRDSDDTFIARYGGDYFMKVQQQARLQEVLDSQKQGKP